MRNDKNTYQALSKRSQSIVQQCAQKSHQQTVDNAVYNVRYPDKNCPQTIHLISKIRYFRRVRVEYRTRRIDLPCRYYIFAFKELNCIQIKPFFVPYCPRKGVLPHGVQFHLPLPYLDKTFLCTLLPKKKGSAVKSIVPFAIVIP